MSTEEADGQLHELLSCGHRQRAPGPGELVLSEPGRAATWGSFALVEGP